MASAGDGKTQGNHALFLPMYKVLWGRGGRGAASILGRAGGRRWLGRGHEVDGSQALRDGSDDEVESGRNRRDSSVERPFP